jgi:hypothetical protein
MPNSIASSIFAQAALVIKNSTTPGKAIATNLKPIRVHIRFTSTPMRHMKEDGTTIVDARMIQPTNITIDAYCPDLSTADQVNSILVDRSSFYSVSSKGLFVDQLMVDGEQIKQSPDATSATPTKITFKQVLTKNTQPIVFAQSTDATMIDRGMTLLNGAAGSATSLAISLTGL